MAMSNQQQQTEASVKTFVWEIGKVFLFALIVVVPIRVFLFQPFLVQGASMEPAFLDGEYLVINEIGYKNTEIGFGEKNFLTVTPKKTAARGDVVVFRSPQNEKEFFIKRVIGLPGETVTIEDNRVEIINKDHPEGFVLDESVYLPQNKKTKPEGQTTLGSEEYFVMGDNRGASSDSRRWGPLHKNDVIGTVLLRAWPVGNFSLF